MSKGGPLSVVSNGQWTRNIMASIPIDDERVEADQSDSGHNDGRDEVSDSNEIIKLRTERDQLFERLARATAEFKNSQKRLETEFDQRMQYANTSLIRSLLPALDNFERALAQDPSKADTATILKGMQIVHDQLMSVLRQQRVEEIAPRPGDPFDPTKHESLMQQPNDQYSEPTVTQLMQKGYMLGGRTLRPAQVAVSKMS
jgi:molecular chaperone GrpE